MMRLEDINIGDLFYHENRGKVFEVMDIDRDSRLPVRVESIETGNSGWTDLPWINEMLVRHDKKDFFEQKRKLKL